MTQHAKRTGGFGPTGPLFPTSSYRAGNRHDATDGDDMAITQAVTR